MKAMPVRARMIPLAIKLHQYVEFLQTSPTRLLTALKTTSNKIQLISKWKKEQSITETVDERGVRPSEHGSNPIMVALEYPEKVRFYKSKHLWEYEGAGLLLDEIFSDELLRRLERLVSCEFVKDLNQSKIFIGAISEAECLRAVSKLDNIKKNLVSAIT